MNPYLRNIRPLMGGERPLCEKNASLFNSKNLFFGLIILLQSCYFISPVYAGASAEIVVDAPNRSLIAPEAEVYQWYYNNAKVEGENQQTLKVAKSGYYTVELLDSKGNMVSQSAAIVVTRATIKKIYLIGDSTVANYGAGSYPQTGWGQVLGLFFNTANIGVDNRAAGGTSSKSFYDSRWTPIKNALLPGDYVFIQFGINDSKRDDPARYTIPFTTFKDYLTKFVNETRAKGAIPVLVSTLRRNSWNANNTTVYDAYHDYPVATRQLAQSSLNVPLIDLDMMSKSLMESLGKEYTTNFWYMNLAAGEYPNFANGRADDVHFQEMGAIEMAKLVVKGIRNLSGNSSVSPLIAQLVPTFQVSTAQSNTSAGLITRTESYPQGMKVTPKARPKSGFTFQRWVDASNNTASTNKMFSFTMGGAARSYSAIYPGSQSTNITIQENTPGFCSLEGTIDSNNAGFTGAGFANSNNAVGAGIKWKINVPSTGSYTLAWNHSNGTTVDRPARLLVNGAQVVSGIAFSSTGNWTTWGEASVNVSLNTGANEIRIEATGSTGLSNIDYLKVTGASPAAVGCATGARTIDSSLINEQENSQVYPNPSTGSFKLKAQGSFKYTIKDSFGKVKEKGQGVDECIAGGDLKPGMYFLKIRDSKENKQIKIIKN